MKAEGWESIKEGGGERRVKRIEIKGFFLIIHPYPKLSDSNLHYISFSPANPLNRML